MSGAIILNQADIPGMSGAIILKRADIPVMSGQIISKRVDIPVMSGQIISKRADIPVMSDQIILNGADIPVMGLVHKDGPAKESKEWQGLRRGNALRSARPMSINGLVTVNMNKPSDHWKNLESWR